MLKKIFALVFLFILVHTTTSLYAQHLSDKAEISILTCYPGNELYATFGHSAIRIRDPYQNIDYVYNYGTFDFSTKGFYIKFIRGKLNYQLAVNRFQNFYIEYTKNRRPVVEHVLDLTHEEKEKIYAYLRWNLLPENKYYKYDFFFDNCATRVRDVLLKSLDSVIFKPMEYEITFRQMLKPYLKGKDWERFGINLLLGMPADKKVTAYESMFLPDYLDTAVVKASVVRYGNREFRLLAFSGMPVVVKPAPHSKTPFLLQPDTVFWILFLVVLAFSVKSVIKKEPKTKFTGDVILFMTTGIIGLLLLFMWFATDHDAVVNNLNVLWANPLNILAAVFILKKYNYKWIRKYFYGTATFYSLLLIFHSFLPQEYDSAVFPIIFLLTIRAAFVAFKYPFK